VFELQQNLLAGLIPCVATSQQREEMIFFKRNMLRQSIAKASYSNGG
jgi:hypothetical protein